MVIFKVKCNIINFTAQKVTKELKELAQEVRLIQSTWIFYFNWKTKPTSYT